MNNDVLDKFRPINRLDDEGRAFLSDRGLSIDSALKMKNVASSDGNIYFLFKGENLPFRWKSRNLKDKKEQRFSTLSEEEKLSYKAPFWNQQNFLDNSYLIITEGEFDCMAFTQLGKQAISLPNGASSVESSFKNNYEYLQQYDMIYIAFDMDKPGDEAAEKAKALLSPHKYRRIKFPFGYKDANEWIQNEPYLEAADVDSLLKNSESISDKMFMKMDHLDDSAFELISLGASSGFNSLDRILGGLRLGEVTVLSAETGSGKTTFTVQLAMQIAQQGVPVWVNSYEMDKRVIMRKFASKVLGKRLKFSAFSVDDRSRFKDWDQRSNIYINTLNEVVGINTLKKQFEIASLVYGIKLIVIDHLDYINANTDKRPHHESIDDVMKNLHILAMEFQVSVILVVHPKQSTLNDNSLTMKDLKGSSGIRQYADNIILLTRMDRQNPMDTRVKVDVCKNRLVGTEMSFYLSYNSTLDGYQEIIKPSFNNQHEE
jgi:twinkle protein